MSPAEYKRFLVYLFLLNDRENKRIDFLFSSKTSSRIWEAKPSSSLVAIGAYCLMPNHFHLYLTPLVDGGISKFMQRLQTAYTMYFNEKHERSGALFQGTFKASHVEGDAYAKYLFSYIHLNPAKLKDPNWKKFGARDFGKLQRHVSEYQYSSLGEYINNRHVITSPRAFPGYLSSAREVQDHVDYWLRYKDVGV